jgi:hypothetical protein
LPRSWSVPPIAKLNQEQACKRCPVRARRGHP